MEDPTQGETILGSVGWMKVDRGWARVLWGGASTKVLRGDPPNPRQRPTPPPAIPPPVERFRDTGWRFHHGGTAKTGKALETNGNLP